MPSTSADPGPSAPLAGILIADFSRILAGPLATQILGDLAADVVKIERPEGGDDTRAWGPPFVGGDAAYYLSLNRNKRSVSIDLTSREGQAEARALVDTADVVVENFRPGLMGKFGLDLQQLRAERPALITCSITAFGDEDDTAAATRPGYDIIVQALSGLMSITGEPDGPPVKVGVALLDVITGLYAVIGIQAALRERDRTGIGAHISVSLFDASVASLVNQAANHLLGGVVPGPMGTAHPNIVPYQVFPSADRPFVLAAGNNKLFQLTCDVIGLPDLGSDARFLTNPDRVANRGALVGLLTEVFTREPADHWLLELEARGVPCAPVRTLDQVFASPEGEAATQSVHDPVHGELRLVANPIRINGTALPVRLPPPPLR